MFRDERYLPLSTDNSEEISVINQFYSAFIKQKDELGLVIANADKYPHCVLLQAYAGAVFILSQSSSVISQGQRFLDRAKNLYNNAHEREKLFIDAIESGFKNDYNAAITAYTKIISNWPKDILSALMIEFHSFEAGLPEKQLQAWEIIKGNKNDQDYLNNHHFWASYSYALELNGQLDAAEKAAVKALELEPTNPWAQHALAHTYGRTNQIEKGIKLLKDNSEHWINFGDFVRGHNWFHLALFYLEANNINTALEIYMKHIKRNEPTMVYMHSDMIVFLWRLDVIENLPHEIKNKLADEWKTLANYIQNNAQEYMFPFLNITYIYTIARSGHLQEAQEALNKMKEFANKQSSVDKLNAWNVGISLAEGSLAFYNADFNKTIISLKPYISSNCIGGSDEQRQIFNKIYEHSLKVQPISISSIGNMALFNIEKQNNTDEQLNTEQMNQFKKDTMRGGCNLSFS